MACGRPTLYNEEMADLICMRVATNPIGLPSICEKYPDLPSHETIYQWRYKYQAFADKYARAKMAQIQSMVDKTMDLASQRPVYFDAAGNQIVDSGYVAANRLEIDTLKWHASKLIPKQYGKAAEEVMADETLSVFDKLIHKLNANVEAASEPKDKDND